MNSHPTCASVYALKNSLSITEASALAQFAKVYGTRVPQILFVSDACTDTSEYDAILPNVAKRVPVKGVLRSHRGHDVFCTDPSYFRHFSDYEYMMPWQLDAWPFRDELAWWEDKGYDYVGAPWLTPSSSRAYTLGFKSRVGGCDGFSLNRVEAMVRVHEDIVKNGYKPERDAYPTDLVKSRIVPHGMQTYEMNWAPYYDQLRFCWNNPGWANTLPVDTMFQLNFGMLPGAVHSPSVEFRSRFCRFYRNPKVIILLSSAIGNRDWDEKVFKLFPYEDDRLVVAFNHCYALNSPSGRRALRKMGRVLTVHNDSVELYWTHAGRNESVDILRNAGFQGLHETMCISWRPRANGLVTYDGEIADVESTNAIREIVGCPASPTAGYIVYRIMRRRYPFSRIVLVDFYGNTHGRGVNFRHDPAWEQKEYEKDPNILKVFT